jgi:hypothetical protein
MKNSVTTSPRFCAALPRRALHIGLVFALAAAASGCASLMSKPEDQVKALANQRWQYLIAGDFDKAYDMATPGFRKIRDLRDYRVRKSAVPVKWLAAEALRVVCTPTEQPTKCVVRVKLDSEPMVPGAPKAVLSSGIDETWLFEDGRWWMFESL